MHRFFLDPAECSGPTLTLSGAEARHAATVLRVRPGERVAVLDGAGHEFLGDVLDLDRHTVTIGVRHASTSPAPRFQITLIQAIAKTKAMEAILQKATELGAVRIVPVLAERSVPHLDAADAERKVEKWRAIAVEAIKQCGSPWLPRVEPPLALPAFLARAERCELTLLASLQPGSRHPREHFQAFVAEHRRPPRTVAVWVGPEGDFTPAESHAIQGVGALPITLGPVVLRSETAALYCLSVIGYELQWGAPPAG